jgi:hypothetical protein
MHWTWPKGYPEVATNGQAPAHLALTSGKNPSQEIIPRIEATQAFRTLGVYIAPSGNQKHQVTVLRSHADHYYTALSLTHLKSSEARWSYSLYLRPRLTYPLPCTYLTPSQCKMIQGPALAALLPKIHLNHLTLHAVLFATSKYGGLSLPDLYIDHGLGQLTLLVGHLKLQDENSNLILSILSHLQLYIGSTNPVMTLPFNRYQKWIDLD